MKRMFTLLLGLMLICSIAVASPVDDLLSKYQDMRLGCEAGINRLDYSRNYRELYVATRKQENTIDKETYDKFYGVLMYYKDINSVWNCNTISDTYKVKMESKIINSVFISGFDSGIPMMIRDANRKEKDLEKSLPQE